MSDVRPTEFEHSFGQSDNIGMVSELFTEWMSQDPHDEDKLGYEISSSLSRLAGPCLCLVCIRHDQADLRITDLGGMELGSRRRSKKKLTSSDFFDVSQVLNPNPCKP